MDDDHVGEWATRVTPLGAAITRAHYVETRVEDRFTTNCGRPMRLSIGDDELTFETSAAIEHRCVRCNKNHPA